VESRNFIHAGEASVKIKSVLKSIGYNNDLVRRVAICAFESEMNIVMHGSDGSLVITVNDHDIIIEAQDNGPGIDDIRLAFREGYSTASEEQQEMGFGAGMGLPNIRNNSDLIKIRSKKDEGTYLKMTFHTEARHE
jgi:anti-sigma regulatory factor (Ser/Thr protein kinase)